MKGLTENDPSSFSNPTSCVITDIHMTFDIVFETHMIIGNVKITVKRLKECKSLILDTRDLTIKKVIFQGQPLKFTLGEPYKTLGSKLEIFLPDVNKDDLIIEIDYETSEKCTALQWLRPEQTADPDGTHPYLFSQCQAIHARSLLPCQDTPSVKMPYTAELIIPADLVGLMSAVKKDSTPHPTDEKKVINKFEQKIPIPSYLIAVVVGALESKVIGPRSRVWTEKKMLEKSAFEFEDTEEMLSTAEALCGEYVWGVYDLLILPPSFPFGGMENPCLTFVTPTLLAGDKSLASVVAHEIAHSWTGNLVTNKNPNHFWLNEGHTVFVERKIVGRMKGEPSRDLAAIGGWDDLQYQIDVFEQQEKNNPLSDLVLDLGDIDPDDAFSTVPYEKGSSLLMCLEQRLGGPEVMEGWLKAYINKFKKMSITTDDWKTFLYDYFKDKKKVLDEVDWNAWLYTPGMPPEKPQFDTTLLDACDALRKKWVAAGDQNLDQFSSKDIEDFSPAQTQQFVGSLLKEEAFSHTKLTRMDQVYKFSAVNNDEIKFRWQRLQIRGRLDTVVPAAYDFVNSQGRMKFVRPIYRDLYDWEKYRKAAQENFKENRKYMHNVTASMVAKDLHLD